MILNPKNSNEDKNLNPKAFLTTLENLQSIPDYQNLGFTLKSLYRITQMTLLTEFFSPSDTEHDIWNIYNVLQLLHSLIPEGEMELLNKLN